MTTYRRSPLPLGLSLRRTLAPREGQGLIEFALVVPIFLLLIFAVIGFGILLENRIALNDAARNGARFAAAQPTNWDSNPTAAPNSIEYAIQRSGSTISIPNDGTGIKIEYFVPNPNASPTRCGYYDPTANSFKGDTISGNSTYSEAQCLVPGNLIKVTVTGAFQLPVPLISAFFPHGVTITTSATAMEEQGP